ncbi:MAG: hypothetical protein JW982_16615 [Spirochaetes bacterium]|nr:hypothetical protein [Spirochaetota bacterium]
MKYKYFILFFSLIFLLFFPVHLWYYFDITNQSYKLYELLELILFILISFLFLKNLILFKYNDLLFYLSFISIFYLILSFKSTFALSFPTDGLNYFYILELLILFLIFIFGLLKLKITPFLSIIWLWQWAYRPIESFYKCRITKEWHTFLGTDIGEFLSFALAILSIYTMYRYFQEFVFHKRN